MERNDQMKFADEPQPKIEFITRSMKFLLLVKRIRVKKRGWKKDEENKSFDDFQGAKIL